MPASATPWSRRLPWTRWLRGLSSWSDLAIALVLLVLATGCPSGPPASGGGSTPPAGGGGSSGGTAPTDGPVVEVAAGAGHTCARRSSGSVTCWGRNDFGQLGDGTTTSSPTPVRVLNIKDAVAIAAGDDHSCALLSTGQPICWGRNDLGQLGDGKGGPQSARAPRPVSVRNLADVTALASGSHHVCALRKAGSLVCWGDNRRRQLGNEGRSSWVAPVAVEGITGVQQLALGEGHTCIRRAQGSVLCWGDDRQGQLGDGGGEAEGSSAAPRVAAGTEGAVFLAAGKSHACIARPSGEVACWGANGAGQIDGKPGVAMRSPTKVAIGGIVELAAGEAHTCARAGDDTVRCWGTNQHGRLGDGTKQARTAPVAVEGLRDAEQLAVGRAHTCVVRRGGKVACWGRNEGGALGTGAPGPAAEGRPLLVLGLDDAASIATGVGFSCARRSSGQVSCWGANDLGQLGNGAHVDARQPVEVEGVREATGLAVGWTHACATTRNGAVLCWGDDAKGQAGGGGKTPLRRSPVAVANVRDAVEVAAGRGHTCVRRRTGEVACWGDNEFGQAGAAAGEPKHAPVAVAGLRDAMQLAAGGAHGCAVRRSGSVACWGHNLFGQLGNGAGAKQLATPQPTPVTVAKLADATEVRLGEHSSCARRTTGQVACWGRNDGGQLGGATQSDWSTRIPVKDLVSAVALGLGPRQACAATSAGQVQCWGHDEAGILGGATGQVLRAPAPPLRGLDRVVEIDPSSTHACARLADGRVACWGSNDRGQLGDGGLDHEPRPVAVTGL